MKEKKYILFDLDGTLTNPKEGITKAVQYSLAHYGIEETDLDMLCPFIGPPLRDSYINFYGFSQEKATEAISVYREYFCREGWAQNKVYPGIPELLGALKNAGKKLYVATSKPEPFAVQILEHFGLAGFFDGIGGADLEETRVRKGDVISYVRERFGLLRDETGRGLAPDIVMVGDREHDIIGAGEQGLESIGVLYGYGSRRELEESEAARIAESVEALRAILLGEML